MVICLGRDADLHMAQLMPLTLTVSCFSKIPIGFTFWYRITRVVPDKGPLNGCVLSRTTRVCQYQNKHSPTHTHEEEEKGFAQTTRSALIRPY